MTSARRWTASSTRWPGSYVIGNGVTGTAANPTGGAGGWLLGDGGAGWTSTEVGVAGGAGGAAGLLGNGGAGGAAGAGAAGGIGGAGGVFMGIGGAGAPVVPASLVVSAVLVAEVEPEPACCSASEATAATAVMAPMVAEAATAVTARRCSSSGGDGGDAGNSGVGGDPTGLPALGGAGGIAGWLGSHGAVGQFGKLPAGLGTPMQADDGSLPPLSTTGTWLTNSDGQVVILHGVNEVYKLPPYLPSASGFSEDDAEFLAANGFNVVRLGVIWAGVEPEPGVIDTAYLASIQQTVQMLADHGIYTVVDMHQDNYSSTFQGEGAPEWATQTVGLPNPEFGVSH